jgi:hypothetical protein
MFRWGFIPTFRADNGLPFGDPSRQALSALNLHLLGLGIQVKLNPPRSPVKNAKVERNQGTTVRWADPAACADYIAFQLQLNRAIEDQREHYPTRTCQGATRAQTFPALFDKMKRFHPETFEVQRVYKHLGKGSWERKVSSQGVIALFARDYQVGFKHRNTTINVVFDPIDVKWVFKNKKGEVMKREHPKNLSHEEIFTFSKCQ